MGDPIDLMLRLRRVNGIYYENPPKIAANYFMANSVSCGVVAATSGWVCSDELLFK